MGGVNYSYLFAYTMARQNGLWQGFPPAMLKAMEQHRVDGDWVSPSDAGGCPRQRILKAREDYYLEPDDQIVPTTGTAIHGLLAGHADDESSSETSLRTVCDVSLRDGSHVPFMLRGTDDYYDHESGLIIDYKTTRTASTWRLLPYDRHVLQINLYAFLRRANGYPVNRLIIWYLKQGGKEPKHEAFEVEVFDMLEMEEIVQQIAEPLAWYQKTGELPQNIYDPKDYNCIYCPVVEHCLRYREEGR